MLGSMKSALGRHSGRSALRLMSTTPPIVSHMPPCDFVPKKYTGPSKDRIKQIRGTNLTPALKPMTMYREPMYINQGHKQYLYDIDGNRYVDMFCGVSTIIAGHCHPRIEEAAAEQMSKLWHTSNIYCLPPLHEYAEKLASKLPDPLKVIYLVNSGAEANDLALLMGRLYTGCMDTMVLKGCYHGASGATMGLTSLSTWYFNYPSAITTHKLTTPDPYKGPWGGKGCRDSVVQTDRQCNCAPGKCEASENYVNEVTDSLKYCAPQGKMGPFFAESIMGVNGIVQFPKGYIKGAAEAVRARGGVVIMDEVQTGFGRTGDNFWGFQGHDVVPDIAVMAKGIANGFPMAAVVTTKEIASVMDSAIHFNTFGGNPVGCAMASTVLDVIEDEKLQENARELGSYYLMGLAKLRDQYEIVGDVRGKGFMMGIELVTDKDSKTALPKEQTLDILDDLKNMRLLCGKGGVAGNILRIQPPLVTTKADVDYALGCFDLAFANHRDRQSKQEAQFGEERKAHASM